MVLKVVPMNTSGEPTSPEMGAEQEGKSGLGYGSVDRVLAQNS